MVFLIHSTREFPMDFRQETAAKADLLQEFLSLGLPGLEGREPTASWFCKLIELYVFFYNMYLYIYMYVYIYTCIYIHIYRIYMYRMCVYIL